MWIGLILLFILTGCAPSVNPMPVQATPYDSKFDEWAIRQCLEMGGTPVWESEAGKHSCRGWQ